MGKTFSKANHSTDGADDNYNYNQKFHGQMNPNQILNLRRELVLSSNKLCKEIFRYGNIEGSKRANNSYSFTQIF
jgi:hypothetical protein